MRIAFFTPLPPVQSAISDIGEGLGMALSDIGAMVDYVIDDGYTPSNSMLLAQSTVVNYRDFDSKEDAFDAILYSLGNHPRYHGYMYESLMQRPGWLFLHDLALHPYVAEMTLGRGEPEAYLDEVAYAYGFRDLRIVRLMQSPLADQWALRYPMFEHIVDVSRGVIAPSGYAAARIAQRNRGVNLAHIPLPFFLPAGFGTEDAACLRSTQRAVLGVGDRDLVIGSFGILVPDKHIKVCLRAFKRVLEIRPDAHYVLGGPLIEGYDLPEFIETEGLSDHVSLTGWMPPQRFSEMMSALDIAIHLRFPHIGGTPYTPIRLMGLGICTIVSDIEPLAEFPQGACIKIPTGVYQEECLAGMLVHLARSPDLMMEVARNGRRFVAKHHNVHRIAEQFLKFMKGETGAYCGD